MFRIKICGVTNPADARVVIDAGADAIGLNFYEQSPRFLTVEQARQIAWSLDSRLRTRVGVFVNTSPARIQEIVTQVGLSAIQLHGDESSETVSQIARTKQPPEFAREPTIIRARRMSAQGVAAIASDLEACTAAGASISAVLVDSAIAGSYGGTGQTFSWAGLADHRRWLKQTPLILAGGLTPDNVAEAIRVVRPDGVDVASGVERQPGVKDPELVKRFVAAARDAFERL
jgi:phosphoribosylanthranilate isomerase